MELKIKDIPDALASQIRERFESEPRICQMRIEQRLLQGRGLFREALDKARSIESLYQTVLLNYIQAT